MQKSDFLLQKLKNAQKWDEIYIFWWNFNDFHCKFWSIFIKNQLFFIIKTHPFAQRHTIFTAKFRFFIKSHALKCIFASILSCTINFYHIFPARDELPSIAVWPLKIGPETHLGGIRRVPGGTPPGPAPAAQIWGGKGSPLGLTPDWASGRL